jgi:hypothetical protein
MRFLSILLLFITTNAFATQYVLVSQQSKIQYSVFKHEFGSINVIGNKTEASSKLLSGIVEVSDLKTLAGLNGYIEWSKDPQDQIKRFATDSSGRDEHIEDMLNANIIVQFDDSEKQFNSDTGDISSNLVITMKDKVVSVPFKGNLTFGESAGIPFAHLTGSMRVNRKDWQLKVSGLAAVGDFLIDNELDLHFDFVFAAVN